MEKATAVMIAKNTVRNLKGELATNDALLNKLKRVRVKTIRVESDMNIRQVYSKDLRSMLRDSKADLYVLRTIKEKKNGTKENSNNSKRE